MSTFVPTEDFYLHISTHTNHKYIPGMVADLPAVLQKYDITTKDRICYFLGQTCEESAGWSTFVEFGNMSYFHRYDGRRDLGNIHPGDGYKYRGMGAIMITGASNFTKYGARMGIDLVNNPDLLQEPKYAFESACLYWTDHNLNSFADKNDITTITKRINGGLNGLPTRRVYTNRALAFIGTVLS